MDYHIEITNYWDLRKSCGLRLNSPADDEIKNKLRHFENDLNNVPTSILNTCIQKMVQYLSDLELATDFRVKTSGLSKNQGLMYDNYLFVKIRNEIIWAAEMAGMGVPVITLYYTSNPNDIYRDQTLHDIINQTKLQLSKENTIFNYPDFAKIIIDLINKTLDLGGF